MSEFLNFGEALGMLKEGFKIARSGWNGKGMWLLLIGSEEYLVHMNMDCADLRKLPWIGMKTADNGFVPWLASQTDILAEDWSVV